MTIGSAPPGKPKVALVLPGLGAGGTERVVNVLAANWAAQGWSVTVLCFEPPGTRPYYAFPRDVAIRFLGTDPPVAGPVEIARRVWKLRGALRAVRPAVVISFLTRTNVVTVLASRGLRGPIIVSERNNPSAQSVGRSWEILRRLLYPSAWRIVTMTPDALALFPSRIRARGRVIPNPVDLPRDWSPRRGGNVLVAVGRLVPQKGFDLLLEAFAQIAADVSPWRLVIWGEGPERGRLEAQRDRLALGERVEFPGVTERPGAWIECADAFVLSSRYEGWGIVLTEAMAAGIPVVAFNCRFGPAEMIEDGVDGVLVPDGQVDELARSLRRILNDSTLRLSLAAAAEHSARRFAPERIAAEWAALVSEAADAGAKQ